MLFAGLMAGAAYLYMRKMPSHRKTRAYVRKRRAKLRARCRRELRASRGKERRPWRRAVRRSMRVGTYAMSLLFYGLDGLNRRSFSWPAGLPLVVRDDDEHVFEYLMHQRAGT